MLPSEFIQLYGRPRIRTINLSGGVAVVLPPDDNRYLLMLISASATMAYGPVEGGEVPPTFPTFTGAGEPVTFTHALHGSLVNMQWVFSDTGIAGTITIAEGFMRKGRSNVRLQEQKSPNIQSQSNDRNTRRPTSRRA